MKVFSWMEDAKVVVEKLPANTNSI